MDSRSDKRLFFVSGRRAATLLILLAMCVVLGSLPSLADLIPLPGSTTEPSPSSSDTPAPTPSANASPSPSETTSPSPSTAPSLASDKADYAPGATVTLIGSHWDPSEAVHLFVNDDVGQTWSYSADVIADPSGGFNHSFQLPLSFVAEYRATATGSTGRTATTTFTDALVVDFKQCENDGNNDEVADSCHWITGSLGSSNALYTEGQAIPQRVLEQFNSDGGVHTLRMRYQFSKDDHYAYDFLMSPDWTVGSLLNECENVPSGPNGLPSSGDGSCAAAWNARANAPIPSDGYDSAAAREYGNRNMFVGCSPACTGAPTVQNIVHDPNPNPDCFKDCGDSFVYIDISFGVPNVNNGVTTVGIWFGAHIAARFKPQNSGTAVGWGTGCGTATETCGASGITGAPYHVRYECIEPTAAAPDGCQGGGSQDNQVQSGGVAPPASLTVVKQTSPSTGTSGPTFSFTTQNDLVGGTQQNSLADTQSFTINNLLPGTYTSIEADPSPNYTLTNINCTGDPTSNSSGNTGTRTATFNLAGGEDVTCTFTNTIVKTTPTVTTTLHNAVDDSVVPNGSTVPLGSSIYDTATVSDGSNPFTGTVTFEFFDNGTCAGTPTVVQSGVAVGTQSNTQGSLGAGNYSFHAKYVAGSDPYHNDSAFSSCEPFTVAQGSPGVSTEIHNGSDHTTDVQGTTIPLGSTIHDEVTVVGNGTHAVTSTVDFTFFKVAGCVPGTGNVNVVSTQNNVSLPASGVAESSQTASLAAGSYSFLAHYDGNANYLAADAPCENVTVGKGNPAVSTEIHNGSDHATDVQGTTIALGSTIHDEVTVIGNGTQSVAGTVDFTFFKVAGCVPGTNDVNIVSTESDVALPASGVAESSQTAALGAGSYSFLAHYDGNSDYAAASAQCENVTVGKADSTTTTDIHNAAHQSVTSVALGSTVHDSATVSGIAAFTPSGSVTFTFFTARSDCTGASVASGTVALVNGLAHPSAAQGPLAAGSYSFQATYGGDGNYNVSTSACEPLTVTKANSSTSTDIHNAAHQIVTSVPLGSTVHDSATVSGITGFTPTGSVTFTFFNNGTCDGTGTAAGSVNLAGGVAHPSSSFGPLAAGSYAFRASYGGDSNYNPSTGPCEPLTVNKAASSTSTDIHNASHSIVTSVPLGATVHDSATVSGITGFTPTGSVTFTFFSNGTCDGTGTAAGIVNLVGGVAHPSNSFGPLLAGSYSFRGAYSGDGNYNASTGPCEPLAVTNKVRVIKTFRGATPPAGSGLTFEFQLRQNATSTDPGSTLETLTASESNSWTLNFTTDLVVGSVYQLCERVMPGWSNNFTNPFSPPDPGGDNSVVCMNFTAPAGDVLVIRVDNTPPPGGLARTIGFWKNWASCKTSSGKQKPVLDQTLAAAEPGGITIGLLTLHGSTTNPNVAPDCTKAVRLLNKSTINNGTKKANDPAFNLAAQLLAAKLNVVAGAAVCPSTQADITAAQNLLAAIHFDGITHDVMTPTQKNQANTLADRLDRYNNNLIFC